MVCGVFGGAGNDGVPECGLPVYGCIYVCRVSVFGDVKIVQRVIFFRFCCEL